MPKGVKRPDVLFQNRGSRFRTTGSMRIDLHYAKLGILMRWDWNRYTRLCEFLNLTVHEMASLILLPHTHLESIERNNTFPGPAALLLTLLEANALKNYTNDVIAEPLPKFT